MSYNELLQLREEWEKGCEMIAVLPHFVNNYVTVYVLLEFDEKFCVNRYFKIGEKWQISVDKQNVSMNEALSFIHDVFIDVYEIACGKLEEKKIEDTKT